MLIGVRTPFPERCWRKACLKAMSNAANGAPVLGSSLATSSAAGGDREIQRIGEANGLAYRDLVT